MTIRSPCWTVWRMSPTDGVQAGVAVAEAMRATRVSAVEQLLIGDVAARLGDVAVAGTGEQPGCLHLGQWEWPVVAAYLREQRRVGDGLDLGRVAGREG